MVNAIGMFARRPSTLPKASLNIIGSASGPSTSNKTQKPPFVTYTTLDMLVKCPML